MLSFNMFNMYCSYKPPMMAVAIHNINETFALAQNAAEFALAMPGESASLLSGEEMTVPQPVLARSRGRLSVQSLHFTGFVYAVARAFAKVAALTKFIRDDAESDPAFHSVEAR